jgi:hypothetical protein
VCHHHRLEAKRERRHFTVELTALLYDISDDKLNGLSSPTS